MFTNVLGYGKASREVGKSYMTSRLDGVACVVTAKTEPLKDTFVSAGENS